MKKKNTKDKTKKTVKKTDKKQNKKISIKESFKKHKAATITQFVIRGTILVLMIILIITMYNKFGGEKMTTGVIETNKGNIEFELYTDKAPITTQNFINLIDQKFYDNILFHRVVEGFVIQAGDPFTKKFPLTDPRIGTGGSNRSIKLEVSPELKHDNIGVLSMARSQDPNSASSQFFITLDKTPHLDMQYAVFGKVTKGIDIVKKIEVGDKIKTIRLN